MEAPPDIPRLKPTPNAGPESFTAAWDGYRNVRLIVGETHIGLATTTYSYALSYHDREQAARRIAALWNLALARGWETEDIESGRVK